MGKNQYQAESNSVIRGFYDDIMRDDRGLGMKRFVRNSTAATLGFLGAALRVLLFALNTDSRRRVFEPQRRFLLNKIPRNV